MTGCSCYSTVLLFPDTLPQHNIFRFALGAYFVVVTAGIGCILLFSKLQQEKSRLRKQELHCGIFFGVQVLFSIIIGIGISRSALNIKLFCFVALALCAVDAFLLLMHFSLYDSQFENRKKMLEDHQNRNERPIIQSNKAEIASRLKKALAIKFGVVVLAALGLYVEGAGQKEPKYYDLLIRIIIAAVSIIEIVHYAFVVYRAKPQTHKEILDFEQTHRNRCTTRIILTTFPLVFFPLAFDTTGLMLMHLTLLSSGPLVDNRIIKCQVELAKKRLGMPIYSP